MSDRVFGFFVFLNSLLVRQFKNDGDTGLCKAALFLRKRLGSKRYLCTKCMYFASE